MSATRTTRTREKACRKESSASRVLDPTFTISKTLPQRNTISDSEGKKKLKAMNMLKQRRDNFQFGGKDKLGMATHKVLQQFDNFIGAN